jgi:hypothetical protein
MKTLISVEKILELADKVSRHYDYMEKMDSEVRICGYGEGYQKEVHIFKVEDLLKIADVLGKKPNRVPETNRLEIVINDVHLFSICQEDTEEGK